MKLGGLLSALLVGRVVAQASGVDLVARDTASTIWSEIESAATCDACQVCLSLVFSHIQIGSPFCPLSDLTAPQLQFQGVLETGQLAR